MPGLDGLRGLAVGAVVVYHFEPTLLPGGFIGVDVFFVLSGFLITSLLLRERTACGTIDVGRFFVRRARRLMPALLLLLCAIAVYAAVWADAVELSRLRRHGLATLGYVSNWVFVADGTTYTDVVAGASPLRHVWSLAIEEQMYLVLVAGVVIAAALGPAGSVRRRFGLAAGVLAVASAAWMWWLSVGGAPIGRTYFGTDTRAHSTLVGAVVGTVLMGRPATDRRSLRVGAWIGLACLVVIAVVGAEDARWLHEGGFLVVALAAGAVVVGCASASSMRAAASVRPLVVVGRLSYGLYLWHWPVLVVLDTQRTGLDGVALTLLRLVVSLTVAAASYHLVEQPIRTGAMGRRWGRRAGAPAVLAIATVTALLVGTTAIPDAGNRSVFTSSSPSTSSPSTSSPDVDRDVDPAIVPVAPNDFEQVVATPVTSGPGPLEPVRVAVVGDSVLHTIIGGEVSPVGLQFSPWSAALTTFDPQLVEVVSIAKPACSFLPGELAILDPNGAYTHASMERFCGDWRTEVSNALDTADVLAVHLSNDVEDRWVDDELFRFGTPEYFALLDAFLDDLRVEASAAGVPLLLIASAPRSDPAWDEPLGEREAMVADFYDRWAATHPSVSTVDVGDFICPGRSCRDEIDGVTVRWDGRHFTRDGAVLVAEWLTPQISAAAVPEP